MNILSDLQCDTFDVIIICCVNIPVFVIRNLPGRSIDTDVFCCCQSSVLWCMLIYAIAQLWLIMCVFTGDSHNQMSNYSVHW